MSSCRWVTTPSWLSGSLRHFLYSSSVYSCHFLLSSAFVRSLLFLSFIVHILVWNVSLISLIFLKKSLVFPFCCFPLSIVHLRRPSYVSLLFSGPLYSVGYIFAFLPCFSLVFFLQPLVRPPQATPLSSCFSFPLGWFWSPPPVQC